MYTTIFCKQKQPCFGADGNDLRTAAAAYMDQNCATTPGCAVENTYGPIEAWCTSDVTDMSNVFNGAVFLDFDADISGWDVSNVQTFSQMFRNAENFQTDLSGWDVSTANNFEEMFRGTKLFNADLSSWELSSATSFKAMFRGASAFDRDLSKWAGYFVPDVGNFRDMFRGSSISQNLCSWDSSFPYSVNVNVDNMFLGANNCQNQTSPMQEVGGPFCANCGGDPEPSLSPVSSSPTTSDPTVSQSESPVTSSPSMKPTKFPTVLTTDEPTTDALTSAPVILSPTQAPVVGATSAPTFVSMIYLIARSIC
jgi:surface protein